jgi:hypothetical protein
MVGLKTFWILISALILFAACVPQTKQTDCGSNEAFNASLRTCVPVVGGPSSFINIASYTPSFTQTRYKDDATVLTFSITVSNPYAQAYTIAWERVFNAGPVSMCSNSPSCSFPASLLGTTLGEVGSHILTAKILDSTGAVVDTHSFELKINDFPKPTINTTTYDPAFYSLDKIPTDARVPFSFTIKNNNATISASDNYRTTWTIVKNGVILLTETDLFTNFTLTGTNLAYFGTYSPPTSVPAFNPATLGVGSYIVRAIVQNDSPGEIVDEHQWNVIIKQPDLAKVTTISLPAPGVTVTAHNGVDYNDYATYSWISGSPATQPNFCIQVDDRDGTYSGDGQSIQVRFYLDSVGGDICTKTTLDSPGTQTICLIDGNSCSGSGLPFDVSLLKFSNSSPSIAQGHKVTARLFDEATSQEFQRSNIVPSSGSYPIEWNVMVNPINTAPFMAFGPSTANPTGCTSTGAYAKSNCAVTQGTPFTVSFSVTDDFYTAAANPAEFLWDIKLKSNGSDISTPPFTTSCSKALGVAVPAYTTYWSCTLMVPHYIASGALHPTGPYQVVATMQDSGSPIGGSPLPSQSLTWNLSVTETNAIVPNITVMPQGVSPASSHISRDTPLPVIYLDPAGTNFVTELETVIFRIGVRDPELDDFSYTVYKCGTGSTAATCVTPQMISAPSINYLRGAMPPVVLPFTDTTNTDPVLVNGLSYTLSETLLLDAGQDVGKTLTYPVYFKVEVADKPSTLPIASVKTSSQIFTLYVKNYNPAPVINEVSATPSTNNAVSAYPVVAGYPFSIDPGTVTDISSDARESTIIYQWYIKDNAGVNWFPIPGATSKNLTWTPDRNAPATVELKLCVGDRPAANPIADPASGGTCSTGSWFVKPKSYFANVTPPPAATGVSTETAIWHDTLQTDATKDVVYTAYIGSDKKIYVNKIVRDISLNMNVSSFDTVSFEAIKSVTPSAVFGISLSGTQNSLYVAYGASIPALNPSPHIRRIDKSFTTVSEEKSAFAHGGKFGFTYDPLVVTDSCAGTNCAFTNASTVATAKITFDSGITSESGEEIRINGVIFKAQAAATNPICVSAACTSSGDLASHLAAKINSNTDKRLQGITASFSGADLLLNGINEFDSLQMTAVINNQQIGKVYVSGGRWYLPIVNASEIGSKQNNITVISGITDVKLSTVTADYTNTLTTIGEVRSFDAEYNQADDLVIASISASDFSMKLSRFQLSGAKYVDFVLPSITTMNPFAGKRFEKVEVAAGTTGNNYIYLLAKEAVSDGGEWNIGRYPADLSGVGYENILTLRLNSSDLTGTYIDDVKLLNPSLVAVPNTSDARLFFTSTNYARIARWKSDNMFSCGICAPIADAGNTSKIAVSRVKIDMTLGTTGYLPNENKKDIAFIFMDYLNGSDQQPQFGMINLESEAIQSTNVDNANHLWRVPFAK